ncbi:hypothetical protein [Nocardioides sp. AX2bis]|uniref:hypothetical protein n=1 Tax=Nocardioides sp. AX2bis TaxID=2653157 RepID=UPI0013586EB3|nr:hypothetical protein [Nocardioides sp. AX2bis]
MRSPLPRSDRPVVTLHVGTPKSGTTSLQDICARNRDLLREHGYLYPGQASAHFIEAMSLRDSGFRGHTFEAAEGAWERVVAEIEAHDGPALISHETLGGSAPKIVKRAVRSLRGRTVRVVVTCRDLGRQLPAVWQEGVKNGDTETYEEFLATTFAAWERGETATGAWRGQNLLAMGERWAAGVGAEQVRFVTVPPAGADKDLLWQRFREATGLPDAAYAIPRKPRNQSLGTVETELLRRVVARLPEDVPWPVFARQVKRRLAQRRLGDRRAGGTLGVPEAYQRVTTEVADQIVDGLRSAGYPVVGDLEDLRTGPGEGTSPADVSDAVLLERALDLLAPLVLADRPEDKARPQDTDAAEEPDS